MELWKCKLLGALVGLARASESKGIVESAGIALVDGLSMVYGDLAQNDGCATESSPAVTQMIEKLHVEKAIMAPDCAACQYPCGRTADYDMAETLEASEALRNAKLELLSLLGALAGKARSHDYGTQEIRQFLSDALFQISCTYEAGQLTEFIQTAKRFLHY